MNDNVNFKGTYLLFFFLDHDQSLVIGKLGEKHFKAGYYYYIGSAFGPGGVFARIKHHIKKSTKPRWHIDYFKNFANLLDIWYTNFPEKRECQYAQLLSHFADDCITDFGCSDCRCQSHFFYFNKKLDFDFINNILILNYPSDNNLIKFDFDKDI